MSRKVRPVGPSGVQSRRTQAERAEAQEERGFADRGGGSVVARRRSECAGAHAYTFS